MKVVLAADHRGFELKEELKQFLVADGYEVEDAGAHALDSGDDYPDFALAGARKVAENAENRGIFLCGSGIGMDVAANKVRGVRASVIHSVDASEHARRNDDINVATLSADSLSTDEAKRIVKAFLDTSFSGEERHVRRLQKIAEIEGIADDFTSWADVKRQTHYSSRPNVRFKERDVFYVRIGRNVGVENNGKDDDFKRPVVVVRKFNGYMFLGVPLTTNVKSDAWYQCPVTVDGQRGAAVITQMRIFDSKRIRQYMDTLSDETFMMLTKKIGDMMSRRSSRIITP